MTEKQDKIVSNSQQQTIIAEDNNLQEVKKLIENKNNTNIEIVKLQPTEIEKVDETFKNVKDFRELGERITSPIDNIIEKTSKIIEKDPIMDVSKELESVNKDVQSVYKEIINEDGAIMKAIKSIPFLGDFIKKINNSIDDVKFNMKDIQGKIEIIFLGFDQSYISLVKSIEMQKEFLVGLEQNIGKVKAYKEYVEKKLVDFEEKYKSIKEGDEKSKYEMFINNVKYFLGNLEVLIGNLELARKRLIMRLDSATKLALSMQGSRPIFKTLLSVAILETAGQKALDASVEAINVMGNTIDKMSSELTDKAIESNKKAEDLSSKPILDQKVFVENVKKLKDHFEQIESYRQKVKAEAEEERKVFKQASEELSKIKEIKAKDIDELQNELVEKK